MKSLLFLVLGKNKPILDIVVRLLNQNDGWYAKGYTEMEPAMTPSNFESLNIVLLSSGLDKEMEQEIKEKALQLNPNVKVIEHYGGGSGLLKSEILLALNTANS